MNVVATFDGPSAVVGSMAGCMPTHVIKDEVMLFGASPDFAHRVGGPLTAKVLDMVGTLFPRPGHFVTVDTRVHMLMPGMYPAIPGWHADGVPRGDAGQPNLADVDGATFYACTFSDHPDGVSNTEYIALGEALEVDPERVWGSVDAVLQGRNAHGWTAADGKVVSFTQLSLHRARPAQRRGWRFWARVSVSRTKPRDEVRKQVQVYTTFGGW